MVIMDEILQRKSSKKYTPLVSDDLDMCHVKNSFSDADEATWADGELDSDSESGIKDSSRADMTPPNQVLDLRSDLKQVDHVVPAVETLDNPKRLSPPHSHGSEGHSGEKVRVGQIQPPTSQAAAEQGETIVQNHSDPQNAEIMTVSKVPDVENSPLVDEYADLTFIDMKHEKNLIVLWYTGYDNLSEIPEEIMDDANKAAQVIINVIQNSYDPLSLLDDCVHLLQTASYDMQSQPIKGSDETTMVYHRHETVTKGSAWGNVAEVLSDYSLHTLINSAELAARSSEDPQPKKKGRKNNLMKGTKYNELLDLNPISAVWTVAQRVSYCLDYSSFIY